MHLLWEEAVIATWQSMQHCLLQPGWPLIIEALLIASTASCLPGYNLTGKVLTRHH